ncbi:hypothetical protein WG66_009482 [Moniliophthora roreri]|nr:hypothetical protein WG66_009482 [Moniliophthora roreri]
MVDGRLGNLAATTSDTWLIIAKLDGFPDHAEDILVPNKFFLFLNSSYNVSPIVISYFQAQQNSILFA